MKDKNKKHKGGSHVTCHMYGILEVEVELLTSISTVPLC